MKPVKIQSNYNEQVKVPAPPIFRYEVNESSYEDESLLSASSLWQSYGDSDKVTPREIESTLWEEPTMDAERIVLSFKQAIDRLQSDALELMAVTKSEKGYWEIRIYGDCIPEKVRHQIHDISFDFGGYYPGIIGDVRISDRRGRSMSNHATFDLTSEGLYALYKLSAQLWHPKQNIFSSGNITMISSRS